MCECASYDVMFTWRQKTRWLGYLLYAACGSTWPPSMECSPDGRSGRHLWLLMVERCEAVAFRICLWLLVYAKNQSWLNRTTDERAPSLPVIVSAGIRQWTWSYMNQCFSWCRVHFQNVNTSSLHAVAKSLFGVHSAESHLFLSRELLTRINIESKHLIGAGIIVYFNLNYDFS